MNEVVFDVEVKGCSVYGVWHRPGMNKDAQKKNVAVILLHGWAGYRPGPHDMLVKIARHLARNEYNCFRFDFRGKGYSQGERKDTDSQSMLEDLEAVLQYVVQVLGSPAIVLAGICSGAKLALYYARNGMLPVTHVVEISCPVLRLREVRSAVAAHRVYSQLNEYTIKLFRRETWYKFASREIHFGAIWQNVFAPLLKFLWREKKKLPSDFDKEKKKRIEKPFDKFKGQMLLIHAEKDPETTLAVQQIQDMLYRYDIQWEICIVRNANHSFYSLIWEKEVIHTITDWLSIRF